MTDAPARRPWWRKTRWQVAVAAWFFLPVVYAAASGPSRYAARRGMFDYDLHSTAFHPLHLLIRATPPGRCPVRRTANVYNRWWDELADRHGRFGR